MKRWKAPIVIIAAVLAPRSPAAADVVDDTFNSLYGEDVRRVRATAGFADDLELARKLLHAARHAAKQPELMALMCRTAHDLAGKDPAGTDAAVEAIELLIEKIPERKGAWLGKLIAFRERRFRAGRGVERIRAGEALIDACLRAAGAKAKADQFSAARGLYRKAETVAVQIGSGRKEEIQARTRRMAARERVVRDFNAMADRLRADPDDKFARARLIELHVIEFDNPAQAAKLLTDEASKSMREHLPLALAKVDDLSWAACLDMGEWYLALSARAGNPAKPALLERARTYLRACLKKHTDDDVFRTRTKLGLAKATAALRKLARAASGQWIDLLKLIDPDKHARKRRGGRRRRRWRKEDDGLATASGWLERITVPVAPDGSYELQMTFRLERKHWGGLFVLLRAGRGRTFLSISHDECKLALKGKGGDDPKAKAHHRGLDEGRDYTFAVKVLAADQQVAVTVGLDGKQLIDWKGPADELPTDLRIWNMPDPRALAIGANTTRAVISTLRLRMLSGKAVKLK